MNELSPLELTERIVEKAGSLGASVAGVADVEALKASPSHLIYPKIGMDPAAPWQDAPEESLHHEVEWPADAVSAVVIGVEHPADRPELDWYDGKGTPGNRILIRVVKELSEWLEDEFSVTTYRPPYFIESTGIFLKDAAVMAGLGCVGRNNLVITPEYGPRVRWRALLWTARRRPPVRSSTTPATAARSPAAGPAPSRRSTTPPTPPPSWGSRCCRASTGPTTGSPATPRCHGTSTTPPGRWRPATKKARSWPRR